MQWQKSESNSQPERFEALGKDLILVRKDIKQETRTGTDGEHFDIWVYDEAKCNLKEFYEFINDDCMAKIYYVAMMTGVDLDV